MAQAYQYSSTRQPLRTHLKFKRFKKWIAVGATEAGKSTFLEWLANKFLARGALLWDLWAAEVFENCFYAVPGTFDPDRNGINPDTGKLKDPKARRVGYPVLIIHPKATKVTVNDPLCTCGYKLREHHERFEIACMAEPPTKLRCKRFVPLIMTVTDDTPLPEIVQTVLRENRKIKRVIVFNEAFYLESKDAYRALANILKQYRQLVKRKQIPNNIVNVLLFRELGDLVTSQMKTVSGNSQTEVRRQIQAMIKKPRHLHSHILGDAQRDNDIAAAVAEQKDYLIIKRSPDDLVPDRYLWVKRFIENKKALSRMNLDFDNQDNWPLLKELRKDQFYLVPGDGEPQLMRNGLPRFHHKRELDDWRDICNVDIEYLDKSEVVAQQTNIRDAKRKEKQSEKDIRIQTAKDAYTDHEENGTAWDTLAKKYGWLGRDGKPSGGALKVFINSLKSKGLLGAGGESGQT